MVARWRCSGGRSEPCHVPLLPEALGPDLAVRLGWEEVAAGAEVVAHGTEGLEEALCASRRLEPLEHALSLADLAVGILRSIVQPLVPPVLHPRQDPLEDRRVADLDAALRQQILDVPVTQGEPVVEPHRITDDLRRKAVAAEQWVTARRDKHQPIVRQSCRSTCQCRKRTGATEPANSSWLR